jgi:hypothetical protein
MYQRALLGYEKALGADSTTTYIPALNTVWGLGFLFERQADSAKAKIMYSKALLGYEKVVGPNHPKSQKLRDNLQVLDTITKAESLENIKEPVGTASRVPRVTLALACSEGLYTLSHPIASSLIHI